MGGNSPPADPAFQSIPIIYVSGLVEPPEDSDEPVLLNGSAAFGKPFKLEAFRRCVVAALREDGDMPVVQPLRRELPSRPARQQRAGAARDVDAPDLRDGSARGCK